MRREHFLEALFLNEGSEAIAKDEKVLWEGRPSALVFARSVLHVRAIISSAEAATVIGKGGENVSQIRRMAGAKCTVSEYTRGAVEPEPEHGRSLPSVSNHVLLSSHNTMMLV